MDPACEHIGTNAGCSFQGKENAPICASEEMMFFLSACLRYGISLCIAGPPDSGKAELAALLYSTLPAHSRGAVIMAGDISAQEQCLLACERSCAGQAICATIQSGSVFYAYLRMAMLAGQSFRAGDPFLLWMATESFSVVAHTRRLADGLRRVMEISEAEYSAEASLNISKLYHFQLWDNRTDNGSISVDGDFRSVKHMSESLRKRFLANGAPCKEIGRLAPGANNYYY